MKAASNQEDNSSNRLSYNKAVDKRSVTKEILYQHSDLISPHNN